MLGEGVQSVHCELTPTRNRLAYAGNAMGRADRLVNENGRLPEDSTATLTGSCWPNAPIDQPRRTAGLSTLRPYLAST